MATGKAEYGRFVSRFVDRPGGRSNGKPVTATGKAHGTAAHGTVAHGTAAHGTATALVGTAEQAPAGAESVDRPSATAAATAKTATHATHEVVTSR